MKLLITAGGCKEPIDCVRHIANFSTGNTGLFLTHFFLKQKHTVTLLISSDVYIPSYIKEHAYIKKFTTFKDIKNSLKSLLSCYHFDGVIQLAAVSDYYICDILVESISLYSKEIPQKITSSKEITLKLKQNPKLLPQLKSFSKNKEVFVVGFKLTDTSNKEEEQTQIKDMLSNKNIDALVHNRFYEITKEQHIAQIYKKGMLFEKVKTKKELAQSLLKLFKN